MDASTSGAPKVQTFMIVWDINFESIYTLDEIDIFSPLFSLNPNTGKNTNWIRLVKDNTKITIKSNFSHIKELKSCTTFMIQPETDTVLDVYEGFRPFSWNKHEWSNTMRFVFNLEMRCDSSAFQPAIWKHFITESKPELNTVPLKMNKLRTERTDAYHDNSGVSLEIIMNKCFGTYNLCVKPKTPTKNFLIFMFVVTKHGKENHYFHFTEVSGSVRNIKSSPIFQPKCIYKIYELVVSLKIISDSEMANITRIIKPSLPPTSSLSAVITSGNKHQLNKMSKKQELQHLQRLLSNMLEYFVANKFCDITIHVQDQQIRAHKIALSTFSRIWCDLFDEDEQVDSVHITDFEYDTIKELIEYIYTGKVKHVTGQLLIAAVKYGVTGLKDILEEKLIETIDLKTAVNLLVLADVYNANALFDKVVDFIGENCKAFLELDEAKRMFLMYPELGFKLFARNSLK